MFKRVSFFLIFKVSVSKELWCVGLSIVLQYHRKRQEQLCLCGKQSNFVINLTVCNCGIFPLPIGFQSSIPLAHQHWAGYTALFELPSGFMIPSSAVHWKRVHPDSHHSMAVGLIINLQRRAGLRSWSGSLIRGKCYSCGFSPLARLLQSL